MRELPAKFQAALPDDVAADDLPVLPDWYPVDRDATEDEPAVVYTAEQRAAARHARALTEARRGPMDGTAIMVTVLGSPPATLPVFGVYTYRLSEAESTADALTYRYAPHLSPGHRKMMAEAVTEGFREYGQEHVQAAQHQEAVHDGITVERTDR